PPWSMGAPATLMNGPTTRASQRRKWRRRLPDAGTDHAKQPSRAGRPRRQPRPPGRQRHRASLMGGALGVKRVGLLRELVPDATAFAVLENPNTPIPGPDVSDVEPPVRPAGLRPIILQASTTAELDAAFAKLLKEHANALVVTADPFFTLHVAGRSLFDVRACDFAQFLQVYAFAHFGEFEAQPAANRGEAGPGYARAIVQ